jgi:hypothetical protein
MVHPYLSGTGDCCGFQKYWHRNTKSQKILSREIDLEIQQRIIRFVTRSNWILCASATALGFAFFPLSVAWGILFGGLLVTINFQLLAKTLKKALTPPHLASHNLVLAKYYLRFLASGFIIFLLIIGKIVHPVGLVVGLSIVVFSIILATICEVKKLIFEEAV